MPGATGAVPRTLRLIVSAGRVDLIFEYDSDILNRLQMTFANVAKFEGAQLAYFNCCLNMN